MGSILFPCAEEIWKKYLLMGSEVEIQLGLHVIEQKKSRRLQSSVNLLPPRAKATCLGYPP